MQVTHMAWSPPRRRLCRARVVAQMTRFDAAMVVMPSDGATGVLGSGKGNQGNRLAEK